MHVPYSIRELMLFGAAAVFARLIFIGFFNTSQTNSWATALSVIAIAGAMEGLGMAIVQSRLRPFGGGDFPLKLYLLTVIGSMVAWILVLAPALSMMTALSSLNLLDHSKTMILVLISGALFGGVIGTAQYFAHRKTYSNSAILIVSKSCEWILLTVVFFGAILVFRMTGTALGIIFVIINTCLISGAIQVFIRNITFDLLNPKNVIKAI